MIEFVTAYWLMIINIYVIGYIISLIINLIFAGINDEDPTGLARSTISWPLDIFYLIGVFILIIKGKK